ncbi:peptide deformylase [Paenibacillus larvae]|uniref:Peptide deformylase n=5 Tax=Paenibacillus larvae TaxID=1464 RepID=V9W8N7_9BACL|nr:peptide deformylase [Paenibacillus larvae]AHD06065.1 peptide deformylase Def [Paenibacillus larvae subsp. larvae DSM 25430]AQR76438.1 peptide deformylase [Paenibacillus larvae subsp. larvae]ARF69826.1 peptide deformylase [Paenibacillus larvae subsp. pulvifaciens]AVF22729.1 peptide deformylase Def [Paenibacillus larvae subsp. larvae]AVG12595.1 peptide deformylase Def [Paenibacillus larvae subsp. larvae DSM 25430]
MAIRIIVMDPDPVLREKAKPVTKFNSSLHKLLDDMADTMYENEGVGLAAPQVGILKRAIVMDVGDEHGLIELVNPEIVATSGEQIGPEGCLSIPDLQGDVRRPMNVTVKGQDRNGNEVIVEGTELLARCIMHEVDHLNGILFTDLALKLYRNELEENGDR